MRRYGMILAAACLSLALPGGASAQDADLVKVCNDLRDPLYFPVDEATQTVAPPSGLEGEARAAFVVTLIYRRWTLYYLRKLEIAKETETSLNLLEPVLAGSSVKAKAALDQVRASLRDEADSYRRQAKNAMDFANAAFERYCGSIEPPTTITLEPLPGLLPRTGVVAAPLPATPPPEVGAAGGGVRFVLVATTPTPSNPALSVADGRVFADGGYYNVETTWTSPPASFGPDGFSLTLGCKVKPPPGQDLASGVDVRGGFVYDPSPPSFDCPAKNGEELSLSRQVTIKPLASQTSGDLFLQIGQYYGGGVTYTYRAEE